MKTITIKDLIHDKSWFIVWSKYSTQYCGLANHTLVIKSVEDCIRIRTKWCCDLSDEEALSEFLSDTHEPCATKDGVSFIRILT